MNYKVYQGTELKQTVTSKIAVMNGLQPNRTYEFGVEADTRQANLLPTSITNNDLIIDDSSNTSQGYACVTLYDNLIAGTVYTFSADVSVIGTATSIDVKPFDKLTTKHTIDDSYTTFPIVDGKISGLVKPTGSYTTLLVYAGNKGNTHGNKVTLHNMSLKRGRVAPKSTTSVTTRGIRFNIPKTLTVGSTITLRYEEYPLGIVPIGNEPSGMFGGGNKQNLSAKVISTANGSSVVEVAGNVIDAGGGNLASGTNQEYTMGFGIHNTSWKDGYAYLKLPTNGGGEILPNRIPREFWYTMTQGITYTQTIWFETDATVKDLSVAKITWFRMWVHNYQPAMIQRLGQNSYKLVSTYTWPSEPSNDVRLFDTGDLGTAFDLSTGTYLKFGKLKLEQGDISTPYASFVDGDTFTAQPDGTCALFSEYKALYY